LGLAELVELVKPNFSHAELNLLEGVISHGFRNELGVNLSSVISLGSRCDLIEEFAEVHADGEINKHILVKGGVVISFDGLDIFKLREATEGVGSAHELLEGAVGLEAFNNKNYVVDLVAVEHHSEELAEGVNGLG